MKTHKIKLSDEFANDVLLGNKTFEIRYNDRNYKVGDYIEFVVVGENKEPVEHMLNEVPYKITYVLSGWGLQDGYVALGIQRI